VKKKKVATMDLPTEKELRRMKLKSCDPYAKRFDSRISDKSLPLKKRNPRRKTK
jgi:hypothetical protein